MVLIDRPYIALLNLKCEIGKAHLSSEQFTLTQSFEKQTKAILHIFTQAVEMDVGNEFNFFIFWLTYVLILSMIRIARKTHMAQYTEILQQI